jgi:hypothetical protein
MRIQYLSWPGNCIARIGESIGVVTDGSYIPTPYNRFLFCSFVRLVLSRLRILPSVAIPVCGKLIGFPVREGKERERQCDVYPVTMEYGLCMRIHSISHT